MHIHGGSGVGAAMTPEGQDNLKGQACLGCKRNSYGATQDAIPSSVLGSEAPNLLEAECGLGWVSPKDLRARPASGSCNGLPISVSLGKPRGKFRPSLPPGLFF